MKKYDMDYVMKRYEDHTSFKLTRDMLDDDFNLVVGSIDVSVTTRCNLKCKNCGSLMHLYKDPKDVEIELITKALDRFFSVVDRVVRVNVIGGEPFLYPNLAEVVEYLNQKPQVVKVVFPTNGTVVPNNDRLYKALRNPKNHVRISHYEAYDKKAGKMLEKLIEEKIDHSIKLFGENEYLWYDFGGFEKRNRTPEELTKQYSECEVEWYSLYRGKLFPCPRIAHAVDLGLVDGFENYVDLLNETQSEEDLRRKLQDFIYGRKYHPCCDHCDRGTGKCEIVPVAEQMK